MNHSKHLSVNKAPSLLRQCHIPAGLGLLTSRSVDLDSSRGQTDLKEKKLSDKAEPSPECTFREIAPLLLGLRVKSAWVLLNPLLLGNRRDISSTLRRQEEWGTTVRWDFSLCYWIENSPPSCVPICFLPLLQLDFSSVCSFSFHMCVSV